MLLTAKKLPLLEVFRKLIIDLWRTIAKLHNQVKTFLAVFKRPFQLQCLETGFTIFVKMACMFSADLRSLGAYICTGHGVRSTGPDPPLHAPCFTFTASELIGDRYPKDGRVGIVRTVHRTPVIAVSDIPCLKKQIGVGKVYGQVPHGISYAN